LNLRGAEAACGAGTNSPQIRDTRLNRGGSSASRPAGRGQAASQKASYHL